MKINFKKCDGKKGTNKIGCQIREISKNKEFRRVSKFVISVIAISRPEIAPFVELI